MGCDRSSASGARLSTRKRPSRYTSELGPSAEAGAAAGGGRGGGAAEASPAPWPAAAPGSAPGTAARAGGCNWGHTGKPRPAGPATALAGGTEPPAAAVADVRVRRARAGATAVGAGAGSPAAAEGARAAADVPPAAPAAPGGAVIRRRRAAFTGQPSASHSSASGMEPSASHSSATQLGWPGKHTASHTISSSCAGAGEPAVRDVMGTGLGARINGLRESKLLHSSAPLPDGPHLQAVTVGRVGPWRSRSVVGSRGRDHGQR
jgi:hypothetical protein